MHTESLFSRPVRVGLGLLFAFAPAFLQSSFAQPQATTAEPGPGVPWQPQIHFSSPLNWINDPNGPIFLNGQYHLFFQLTPKGDPPDHKSWGHAVSSDLVHWKELPIAIAEEDSTAIYSGSTVEDRDNTSGLCGTAGQKTPGCLIALYTGASPEKQVQNLAISRDGGATWTKFSANPVIDLGLKDFRDPKVFWHTGTQSWVMVVALPTDHKVRFYRSKNLRQWELTGEFGPAGAIGGVWECPDLFELPVYGADGKFVTTRWVLNVNLNPGGPDGGSGDQYFVGKFDGSHFVEDHPGSGPHWVDWGKDFYASTTFSNLPPGQDRTWIAWMDNWQYAHKLPSLPGQGEMTLARRIYLRQPQTYPPPTPSQEPLLLVQEPILALPADKPYRAMFGAPAFETIDQVNARIAAKKLAGSVYRLRFTLDPGDASEAGVRLRRSTTDPGEPATEETVVGVDLGHGRIFVDRTHSGKTDWSPDFPVRVSAPLRQAQSNEISIQIVVDNTSIEVFAENGETVLTDLIFPSASSQGLAFYSTATPPGTAPAGIRDVELVALGQQPKRK